MEDGKKTKTPSELWPSKSSGWQDLLLDMSPLFSDEELGKDQDKDKDKEQDKEQDTEHLSFLPIDPSSIFPTLKRREVDSGDPATSKAAYYCEVVNPGDPAASKAAYEELLEALRRSQPDRVQRLQRALDAKQIGDLNGRLSAIRVHKTVMNWVAAACWAITSPRWMNDPRSALIFAAEGDYEWCCAAINQALDQARDDGWLPLGIELPPAPPVLRIEDAPNHGPIGEAWLSPGCRELDASILLPALHVVQLGIHVV
ncbi:hypothetical protein KQ297_00570 [Synechococcus sp. CS-205]|nr:hypothetical protein [Synechococcus sp. CS-205]